MSLTGQCLPCANLGINCINCSSATTCLTCDNSFVFLNSQCLSVVPNGYVNISGTAYPCTGDCSTCSVTVSNCTSCKTMSLDGNACVSPCPLGTISVNVTTV